MRSNHTTVTGRTRDGRQVYGLLTGTWAWISAARWARAKGAVGNIQVNRVCLDYSGRGRSGSDGAAVVLPDDTVRGA